MKVERDVRRQFTLYSWLRIEQNIYELINKENTFTTAIFVSVSPAVYTYIFIDR